MISQPQKSEFEDAVVEQKKTTDVKRNVAYKIGPMTRDDVIYSTTQLYNPTPATFPGNSLRVSQRRIKALTLRRKAKTIWRACGQE